MTTAAARSDDLARSMGTRVMIVDDDRDYIEALQELLEAHGYETAAAHDEASALRLLCAFAPQIAVIDVRINKGSGVELLRLLTEQNPDLISIMVTAYAETATLLEALRSQAYDYLRKPIKPGDLFDSLNRAMDKIALRAERDAAQLALQASEQRFRVIADTSPMGLIICGLRDGRINYVNSQAETIFGYESGRMLNQILPALFDDIEVRSAVAELLAPGMRAHGVELMLHTTTDNPKCLSLSANAIELQGEHVLVCAVLDVTKAYELAQQLSYQAAYDPLTGLVNRREFETRLQRVITRATQAQSDNALLYIDLDQFKVVNDTCGHTAGDELLRLLGHELQSHIRKGDTLARLGGDEFAVLLENCEIHQATRVANAIRLTVQDFRFGWEGNTFKLGASIGLVPIGHIGETVGNVMRRVDAACYAAKDKGRNRVHIYDSKDVELAQRHGEMRWVARLNDALENNRFVLYAQRIVPISGGAANPRTHIELLIRMLHDDDSTIPPGAFLPAAERYNLAARLDRWVATEMFRWMREHPALLADLEMCSINISGQSLGNEEFIEMILSNLHDGSIPAGKICFEITETSAIANLSTARTFIHMLKEYGCSFALDDFGSGLSSFAYLKTLPVDFLKIDGQFVKDILIDPIDLAMVKSINDIGHVMGKKTIAEFVENDAILEQLRATGVDYAQGYGVGKPMPLSDLAKQHDITTRRAG